MAIMHDGTKVTMGGREFILPPLTLKALRSLGPKIKLLSSLADVPTPEQVDVMVELVHASAVRNYPEITPDDLLELLDLGNLTEVFPAVMAASGLKKRMGGDGQGEVAGS